MAYDIFPYLSDNDQLKLLQQARVNRFEQGAIVVDQNGESRSIYIVRDGSVVVELYDGGAWIQLAHLGARRNFW
jgi:CRP-like cAMP-binding protein